MGYQVLKHVADWCEKRARQTNTSLEFQVALIKAVRALRELAVFF